MVVANFEKKVVSCILHSYCGLEAALNVTGYQLFLNAKSPRYIPPAKRDLALKRLIKSWEINLAATDKLHYILSVSGKTLQPKLGNELRELNILRNWIAHGFVFTSVILLEKQPDGSLLGVDREDSIDWERKFPNTKFQPLMVLQLVMRPLLLELFLSV